jgi:hypothetical protein
MISTGKRGEVTQYHEGSDILQRRLIGPADKLSGHFYLRKIDVRDEIKVISQKRTDYKRNHQACKGEA